MGYNPVTQNLVHRVCMDGAVHESVTATKASIDALGISAADSSHLGGRLAVEYQLRADATTNGSTVTLTSETGPVGWLSHKMIKTTIVVEWWGFTCWWKQCRL